MEGITILETQVAYDPNLLGICFLIFGIVCTAIGTILIIIFDYDAIAPFLISINLFIIIFGLFMIIIPIPSSNKAIYTVKIEEKVNLNEFLSRYEIISHEKYSNIYKIKGDIINND